MFQVSEEVHGIKFMYSSDDKRTHLIVLRTKKMGYESYCRAKATKWTPTGSTEVTCPNCKKATVNNVSSDSETT